MVHELRTAETSCQSVMAEIAQSAELEKNAFAGSEPSEGRQEATLSDIDLRRLPQDMRPEVDKALGSGSSAKCASNNSDTSHALPRTLAQAMQLVPRH